MGKAPPELRTQSNYSWLEMPPFFSSMPIAQLKNTVAGETTPTTTTRYFVDLLLRLLPTTTGNCGRAASMPTEIPVVDRV